MTASPPPTTWRKTPDWVWLTCSGEATRLWCALMYEANRAGHECREARVSAKRLAQILGCSRNTVWKYIAELEERRAVTIERNNGTGGVYCLHFDPPRGLSVPMIELTTPDDGEPAQGFGQVDEQPSKPAQELGHPPTQGFGQVVLQDWEPAQGFGQDLPKGLGTLKRDREIKEAESPTSGEPPPPPPLENLGDDQQPSEADVVAALGIEPADWPVLREWIVAHPVKAWRRLAKAASHAATRKALCREWARDGPGDLRAQAEDQVLGERRARREEAARQAAEEARRAEERRHRHEAAAQQADDPAKREAIRQKLAAARAQLGGAPDPEPQRRTVRDPAAAAEMPAERPLRMSPEAIERRREELRRGVTQEQQVEEE